MVLENNLLNNCVLNLLDSIEQNLSSFLEVKEPECLHHLRVDVKKINAIFSFAEKIYKENYDTTLLKPLFKDAGKIREMQINILLLNENPHSENDIAELIKREKILSQQFIMKSSQYIMDIKNFRENVCFPELLPGKKTITQYLKKEEKKAKKILRNIDKEGLHRYRKRIKKILYIYKTLPKRLQDRIELKESKINKQQKELGDWHDTYSAINFFSQEHYSKQASEYILKLKKKEERQFNTLLLNLQNKGKRNRN